MSAIKTKLIDIKTSEAYRSEMIGLYNVFIFFCNRRDVVTGKTTGEKHLTGIVVAIDNQHTKTVKPHSTL